MPCNIPDLPQMKVDADSCELDCRVLLVLCDYYSNYVKVESTEEVTIIGVVKVLRSVFAWWGIPSWSLTLDHSLYHMSSSSS
jgi:hypothetical protein